MKKTLLWITAAACSAALPLSAGSAAKRYPFKSAIVKYSISGDFQKGTETLYIDDYGARTRTERHVTMTIMGMTQKDDEIVIDDGAFMYRIDLDKKTGTKTRSISSEVEKAFAQMSPEQKQAMEKIGREMVKGLTGKNEIKPVGTGTVLGRECEIYDVMGARSWQWKKLVLRMESPGMGNMKQVAVELKVNCPIPEDAFRPPDGVTIVDYSAMTGAAMQQPDNPPSE